MPAMVNVGYDQRLDYERGQSTGRGRTDRDHAEESDLGKDGLEVTSRVVVGTDKGSGAAEEGVGTGRDDDSLGLTVLAGRAREALVALLLVDGERLAGEGGLVHRDVDRLGKTAVGGADVTVLERDEVTGNEGSRLWTRVERRELVSKTRRIRQVKRMKTNVDFSPLAVALDLSLRRERVHKSLDGVTGVALLNETNGRVDL